VQNTIALQSEVNNSLEQIHAAIAPLRRMAYARRLPQVGMRWTVFSLCLVIPVLL
jgi:hypothetical protein